MNGKPKISDFDVGSIFFWQENILRFEIPVQNSFIMKVLATLNELFHDNWCYCCRQFSFLFKLVVEGSSLIVFSDNHKLFLLLLFLNKLKNVRMLKLLENTDLVVDELFTEGILDEAGVDNLDADSLVLIAFCSEYLCSITFSDLPFCLKGFTFQRELMHSSSNIITNF